MKKCLCILLAFAAGTGLSLGNGLGVYGSYWSTKDAGDGFGAGGKLNFSIGDVLGIDLRGGYFPNLAKNDDVTDVELQVIPAEAGLTISIPTGMALTPYIGGGAGYYFLDMKLKDHMGDKHKVDVDNEVGWYALAGLQIKLGGNWAIFGEGKYTQIEAKAKNDDIEDLDSDLKFKLDGFGGNAGLLLIW